MDTHCLQTEHHAFNPYPYFGAEHKGKESMVWPRGFQLSFINDIESQNAPADSCLLTDDRFAVFQSLANHDPDVDAIYRLTRPLPISFRKQNTLFVPPRGTYIPWNAQATVLKKGSILWPTSPCHSHRPCYGHLAHLYHYEVAVGGKLSCGFFLACSQSVSQSTFLYERF